MIAAPLIALVLPQKSPVFRCPIPHLDCFTLPILFFLLATVSHIQVNSELCRIASISRADGS